MNILIDGQTLHTAEINRGIGTYFKEMIEAMLHNDFVNVFYITVDEEKRLDCFSDYAKNKLIPLFNKDFNPSTLLSIDRKNAMEIYSDVIDKICIEKDIKVYWNPNPQMDNTILPVQKGKTKFVATTFDLIPLIMKDVYFSLWPNFIKDEYNKKLKVLNTYDHLFPISQSTKNDAMSLTSIAKDKQTVAFCGVSSKFKPYPFPTIVTDEKYILYIGGFDPRKNMFRAIDAFSIFLKKYNEENIDYKLYLVCKLNDESRKELEEYAKKQGVKDSLVLTGFVEDKELLKLYQKARCFFFPSLYEGFGLPVLEALASGLPVACADNSSLPEVAKDYAHYFNAYDSNDMAKSLQKTLQESMSLEDRIKRYNYASQYTWDKPAQIVLDTVVSLNNQTNIKKDRKIAWVSPLPPQRSGISNYSKLLLLAVKDKIEIDIYYDKVKPEKDIAELFRVFPLKKLPDNFNNYDEVIYHLGNNTEFHTNIYKYAWDYPSTVVIHDWNMHPFMQHSFLHTKNEHYYMDALKVYGDEGVSELEMIKSRGYPDIWRFPMSDAIAKRSKRVIVHHQWVKQQFIRKDNVEVIPHFSYINKEPSVNDIVAFKDKYSVLDSEYLISMFGDINKNKLPNIQIEAVKQLLDRGYPIKLVFAGKVQPETEILFEQLKGTVYESQIISTGYLSDMEYFSCLYASDMVINLRNPSMGEASGTLMQAFFALKAVIIGDLNQYKEFPDEIVAGKVKYDGSEVEQLVKILRTQLENKQLRTSIGKKAKLYSGNVLALKGIVKKYLKRMDHK
jgi:glycosyltransferase involved in cell wall biosynthesis